MSSKPSLGESNYSQFADRYAALVPSKPHNAFYDRPAVLSLLPPLEGKRALDAGCGPGEYSLELLERGAGVVAVDVTSEFVVIARERLGGRATVVRADLADGEFDVVVAALVLDYIEDWGPTLGEFYRVLKPGGVLVFSGGHPFWDWKLTSSRGLVRGSYFDREQYTIRWSGFGEPRPEVTAWRRSLGEMVASVLGAGFALEAVVEPLPTEQFRQADPERFEALLREPCFLCVRARKP